jgi:hypothetical protein
MVMEVCAIALEARRVRSMPTRAAVLALLLGLLGSLLAVAAPLPSAAAVGTFVAAPTRVDTAYDAQRGLVYVSTTAGEVLRYDLAAASFLAPFTLGGRLQGIDVSPDGRTLVAADATFSGAAYATNGTGWIHVVDLVTGASRKVTFTRDYGEAGTFTVVFLDDTTVLVTSAFSGSGWVPMRRVDLATGAALRIASVRQNTMLSASADRSAVAYAESNISSGEFGVYRPAGGTFREGRANWFLFEIGANRDGTQFSVPTYGGMYVFDANLVQLARLGTYATSAPIGVVYHPTADVVYLAWFGTQDAIQAWDTRTLQRIGVVDDSLGILPSTGNSAFNDGRLRISPAGDLLLATVPGGVKIYSPIDYVDDDRDDDGVVNGADNCPDDANPAQEDADGSGIGDACNGAHDRDGDEYEDGVDVCPDASDPTQADLDGDLIGDACNDSVDWDGDDWQDAFDNCRDVPNDQSDGDGDTLGDACDPFPGRVDHVLAQCEVDRDGARGEVEELRVEVALLRAALDQYTRPPDGDADGVPDRADRCSATPPGAAADRDGCSLHQFCAGISLGSPASVPRCVAARWVDGETGATGSCRPRSSRGLVCAPR